MIVGPRYNDVDPAVEAAYERTAAAATSKLDAIAARLEAATPGPWEAVTDNDGRTKEHSVWSEQSSDYVAEWIVTKPDADLIAHAPADLAALLAVVREVAALHRPLAQHHHEAHCPRRFEEQHAEARHTESEYGGEYVCLDMPLGAVCEECRDEDGEHAEYPCPTATALAPLAKEEADV